MDIKKVQAKLGLNPDGVLGPKTFSAIASYAVGRPVSFDFSSPMLTTPARIADFIGQTAHESANYTRFVENLNYANTALLKQWPTHFNKALADWAHRNPERVAEVAYGVKSRTGKGRMGNTAPGDGWKYRGRGALQLTGKANYAAYSAVTGLDLVALPEKASDPSVSLRIASAYYTKNNIWARIDKGDTLGARKAVNGGTIGYTHVNDIRNKVLSLFK
jgi:putative chitinase